MLLPTDVSGPRALGTLQGWSPSAAGYDSYA